MQTSFDYVESAIRSPDNIVPGGLFSVQEDPLVVFYVGCSTPGGIIAVDFHIPLSTKSVFYFFLNVFCIAYSILAINLIGI